MLACSVQIISHLANTRSWVYTIFRPPCWRAGPYWVRGLCKFVRNISTNNWRLEKRAILKPGSVSSLSISYNITYTISWLHPLSGFPIIFLLSEDCVTVQSQVPRTKGPSSNMDKRLWGREKWWRNSKNIPQFIRSERKVPISEMRLRGNKTW